MSKGVALMEDGELKALCLDALDVARREYRELEADMVAKARRCQRLAFAISILEAQLDAENTIVPEMKTALTKFVLKIDALQPREKRKNANENATLAPTGITP